MQRLPVKPSDTMRHYGSRTKSNISAVLNEKYYKCWVNYRKIYSVFQKFHFQNPTLLAQISTLIIVISPHLITLSYISVDKEAFISPCRHLSLWRLEIHPQLNQLQQNLKLFVKEKSFTLKLILLQIELKLDVISVSAANFNLRKQLK